MGTQKDRGTLAVLPHGITLAEFARWIERNTMINLRVGMPAEVIRWRGPVAAGVKSKPALVDVQPHFIFSVAINSPDELTDAEIEDGWTLLDEPEGYVKQRALQVINNVRVHYPGHKGLRARGPLKAGEVGWLKFADRSLDKWTQTGGPVDPAFSQFHDLTDAVFEPGLRYGQIAVSIDDDKHVIGPEDGSAGLSFDDVEAPNLPNVELSTTGESLTLDAATRINVGAEATELLDAIRKGDLVNAGPGIKTWAAVIEAGLNTVAAAAMVPPIIVPGVNDFNTLVGTTGANSFGVCASGSQLVKIE